MLPTLVKVKYGLHAILVQAFFVFEVMWIIIEALANAVHESFIFGNCPDDMSVESIVLDIKASIIAYVWRNFVEMIFHLLFVIHSFHERPAFD